MMSSSPCLSAMSSSFWYWSEYKYADRKVPVYYEKFVDGVSIIEDLEFAVKDGLSMMKQKGMFMDKTLVLDIDLTLGHAGMISHHKKGIILEYQYVLNLEEVDRLEKLGKVKWFQNKKLLFFIRPFFKEFIQYCDRNFKEVIIWTLGNKLHSEDMQELCKNITGKTWKAYCRTDAECDIKNVTKIGLDPSNTWMVDDDHRHYWEDRDDLSRNVNSGVKFFHTPEFNIIHSHPDEDSEDFANRLYEWGRNIEVYDDWFPFLIWNWTFMSLHGLNMRKFIRNDCKFVYQ